MPVPPRGGLLTAAVNVVPFLVPGHLDRFEELLVRTVGLAFEPLDVQHPFVQVREAHGQRVERVVLLEQLLADVAGIVPVHDCPPLSAASLIPASDCFTTSFMSKVASGLVAAAKASIAFCNTVKSLPAIAVRKALSAASMAVRSLAVRRFPACASAFSVCRRSASALFFSSMKRRAAKSSRAFSMLSVTSCSTSAFVKPCAGCTVTWACAPLRSSFADTVNWPF